MTVPISNLLPGTWGRSAAVVGLALFLLAACAAPSGSGTGTVSGHVLGAPGCPVERLDSPCPPRPMSGVTVTFRSTGGSVETAKTDSGGAYSIDLAAGTWKVALVARPSGRLLDGPAEVVVASGRVTVADFTVDSGIR
jgi:hypothetical protein